MKIGINSRREIIPCGHGGEIGDGAETAEGENLWRYDEKNILENPKLTEKHVPKIVFRIT